jgi:glutathione S-transferase
MALPAFPAFVTMLAVGVLIWNVMMVGRARSKYGVKAPAVTGHPMFENAYRVQMNTIEQFAAFLPSLWLFALLLSSYWAGWLGLAWVAGRVLYGIGYAKDPKKREPGFAISAAATLALAAGALYESARLLIA